MTTEEKTPAQQFILSEVVKAFGQPKSVKMEEGTLVIDLTNLGQVRA